MPAAIIPFASLAFMLLATASLLRKTDAAPSECSGLTRLINGTGSRWDARPGTLETGEVDRHLSLRKSKA